MNNIRHTFHLYEDSITSLDLYSRALKFASFIHRNQNRKYSNAKYITHPISVSMILSQWGYNNEYQSIGLLHDTIEDASNQSVVEKAIKKYFGNSIYKIIKLLSHDKSIDYNSYLLKLARANKIAFIIKMADMWSNLHNHPSNKQINKYSNALTYLYENGIKLPKQMKKFISTNKQLTETIHMKNKSYILDDDAEYYVRYSDYIEEDLKRGWSSWSFGGDGFDGTFDDLLEYINDSRNGEIEISGFNIWIDENPKIQTYRNEMISVSGYEFRELYDDYWVAIDNVNAEGGISAHYVSDYTINKNNIITLDDLIQYIRKNKLNYDGTGDGDVLYTDHASVIYQQSVSWNDAELNIIEYK